MDKKAEVATFIAIASFVVVMGSLLAGKYVLDNEQGFVGDVVSKDFYEFDCDKVNLIEESNRVYFSSFESAKSTGYEFKECKHEK
jgi:hypothetical protein